MSKVIVDEIETVTSNGDIRIIPNGTGALDVKGVDLSGLLRENVKVVSGTLSANSNINLEDGMVHYFTTTEVASSTPNIRFNSTTTLDSVLGIGEVISISIITTAAANYFYEHLTIDGNAVVENWVGGSAPSDGGASGVDIYTYTIIKTASATFTVIGNQSKTS
tara:strand:+ start:189 stop:680 length:492 start_codon:yes stop_codon:yes gene_type:complete